MLHGLYETFVDAPFNVELGLALFGMGLTEAVLAAFPVLFSPDTDSFFVVADFDTLVGFPVLAIDIALFETEVKLLAWFPVDTNSAAFGFSAAGKAAGKAVEEVAAEDREIADELVEDAAEMLVDFVLAELGDLTSVEVGETDEEGDVVDNLIGITLSVIIWIEDEDDELDIEDEDNELDTLDELEVAE